MVKLPSNTLTEEEKYELLFRWYEAQQELKKKQAQERILRETVVAQFFPDGLDEGTNNVKLKTNDVLTVVQPINRKVDKAIYSTLLPQMVEAGIDVNEVVETKVELRVGNYRKLTPKQLAVFDECVTSTNGSPQVSIKIKS